MSLHKHALIRYRIIDSMIRNKYKPYPSIEEIRQKCEESIFGSDWEEHICKSTIEKDLHAMRFDTELGFEAPIKFSRKEMGYYYTDPSYTIHNIPLKSDDIDAIKFASNTLFNFRESPLFDQFRFAIEKIFDRLNISDDVQDERLEKVVQFDTYPEYPGNEYLQPLYASIKDQKAVKLYYQRFNSKQLSVRTFHPYLLKEYKYRWYVVGRSIEKNIIATYALDRITQIKQLEDEFTLDPAFNFDTFFKYSFGITQTDTDPVQVVLDFPIKQLGYIQTQPIHDSQIILKQTSKQVRVSIEVILTYELLEKILSYGEDVEVIAPQELRNQISERLSKALAKYQ